MAMKELLQKLMDAGKKETFSSPEELAVAAKELGYTEEEIKEILDELDGFPLEDDDLKEVAGGASSHRAPKYRPQGSR